MSSQKESYMSNRHQQTSDSNKGQKPERPNLPAPGQNPDFPEEPIGPGTNNEGSTTTPPSK